MARQLTFSEEERARLAVCCKALSTTFEEFAKFAVMQAVSECEGLARDSNAIREYYERNAEPVPGRINEPGEL